MDEVEVRTVRDAIPDWVHGDLPDVVPAHVWDLQTIRKATNPPWNHIQTRFVPLFAGCEEDLEPHADSQKWSAPIDDFANRIHKLQPAQPVHDAPSRPHS